jgi:invasion protein IalB
MVVLVGSAAAIAQSRPPVATPPAASAEPRQTTAVFGDWTLRCLRIAEADKDKRACEVTQTLQTQNQQGQNTTFATLAVGRLEPGKPLRLIALMPSNVSFPSSVQIFADEKDAQPVELVWRRCIPGTCVADVELSQSVLTKLRARTEGGKMNFRDSTGREISTSISLNGFAPALDALAKEF